MEQKEFDDLINKITEAIKPIYEENKELKTVLSQKTGLEEKYKERINLLEEELRERDNALVDTDKAYGQQRKDYQSLDNSFRGLYERARDGLKKMASRNLTMWGIINKKNSIIKSLKDEIANLKEVYGEKKE